MIGAEKWNWIFDWSGTLVNDLDRVICATNYVMQYYGKQGFQKEQFRKSFQLPYEGFYQEHLPDVPLEEVEEQFRQGFALSQVQVPILPHAQEFLDYLQQKQHRMFVFSSMCSVAFQQQVQDLCLEEYFEATYAGILDKRQQIHDLLQKHDLDPSRTIFVGDMMHDIDTAKYGGVSSIGVLTGYNHREVLESAQPSLIAENLYELQMLLSGSQDWNIILSNDC